MIPVWLEGRSETFLYHGRTDVLPSARVLRLPETLEKDDQLLFQSADMAECLAGLGYNVEKLSIPYVPQVTGEEPQRPRSSWKTGVGGLFQVVNLVVCFSRCSQSCTLSEKSCTDANRRPEVPAASFSLA